MTKTTCSSPSTPQKSTACWENVFWTAVLCTNDTTVKSRIKKQTAEGGIRIRTEEKKWIWDRIANEMKRESIQCSRAVKGDGRVTAGRYPACEPLRNQPFSRTNKKVGEGNFEFPGIARRGNSWVWGFLGFFFSLSCFRWNTPSSGNFCFIYSQLAPDIHHCFRY